MVEFENRDIKEIRISKEEFHNWLESKIPDLSSGDNVISVETDPQNNNKYLIKIEKGG